MTAGSRSTWTSQEYPAAPTDAIARAATRALNA